jgi:hypothetical protein
VEAAKDAGGRAERTHGGGAEYGSPAARKGPEGGKTPTAARHGRADGGPLPRGVDRTSLLLHHATVERAEPSLAGGRLPPGLSPGRPWVEWSGPLREFVAWKVLDLVRRSPGPATHPRAVPVPVPRLGPPAAHPGRPAGRALAIEPGVATADHAFRDQLAALGPARPPRTCCGFRGRQSLVEYEWIRRPEGATLAAAPAPGGRAPAARAALLLRTAQRRRALQRAAGVLLPGPRPPLRRSAAGAGSSWNWARAPGRAWTAAGPTPATSCRSAAATRCATLCATSCSRPSTARPCGGSQVRLGNPDWQAPPGFWRELCSFMAKVLALRPEDRLAPRRRSTRTLSSLTADVNALVEIVREKAPLLATSEYVPPARGCRTRSGRELPLPRLGAAAGQAQRFAEACEVLAADGPGHLLVGPGRAGRPRRAAGLPCAQCWGLPRPRRPAAASQVDVAVGVRSTQARLEGQGVRRLHGRDGGPARGGRGDEGHGVYGGRQRTQELRGV